MRLRSADLGKESPKTNERDDPGSLAEYRGHLRITPVVVLGTFHSGTTILYRMLAMHPEATWFSQFSQRGGTIPGRRRLPFYAQIDRLSRQMSEHDWNQSNLKTRIHRLIARPTEGQTIWEYMIPRSDTVDASTSVDRMRRILDEEGRRSGRRFFVSKYPYLSRYIPVVRAAYPQTKFVHIVRDGRAVALSLAASRQRQETLDYEIRDGRRVPRHRKTDLRSDDALDHRRISRDEEFDSARLAQYWLRRVRMIHAEKPGIDLTEIRYEDLCEDVHGHLATLLTGIGLDVDRFPFDRCPATLTSTNRRWLEAASPSELQTLETLLSETLRIYAYI